MLSLLFVRGNHQAVMQLATLLWYLLVCCTATLWLRTCGVAQQHLNQLHWHIWQCLLHIWHAVASLGLHSTCNMASIRESYCAAMQHCHHKAAQSSAVTGNWATLQIQTSIQHAVMLVYPYPRCPDSNELLELLALRHNEESIEALMRSADMDDLQHIANWETVIQYAASLDASNVHNHVPFFKTSTL